MFALLYEFRVKENMDVAFMDNWKALTQLIQQYAGSFGSRLHRRPDGVYIAYALWPDKETFEEGNESLPTISEHIRSAMRATCDEISTLHEMTVVDDMLKE